MLSQIVLPLFGYLGDQLWHPNVPLPYKCGLYTSIGLLSSVKVNRRDHPAQHNYYVLDILSIRKYNVITMITNLVPIGNSKGIRIPKVLLEESGLGKNVELKVKKGEIRITAAPKKSRLIESTALLSEKTLARDWEKPEEDKAWESLQ